MGLNELLETSDVLSIHTPLTENTHHLIDRQCLQQTVILINTTRGPAIDEAALIKVL